MLKPYIIHKIFLLLIDVIIETASQHRYHSILINNLSREVSYSVHRHLSCHEHCCNSYKNVIEAGLRVVIVPFVLDVKRR
ncbi:hypothetical protein L2E82_30372 [Cichorium intybus]|uniref:Uncharacterized protein n=1 Tax=Cichorium intybus TaxID=13427 RepID=A0ACB9D024_CICIN|nr:hypothetical protein L2E82_30372 [Cichorium intybus]